MKRAFIAALVIAAVAGCLSPTAASKADINGKASPKLKDEAVKASQLPLVLPDTITEQNHKQKLQAFEQELATDRESGGRAYVDTTKK